jgi:hypothetical protein
MFRQPGNLWIATPILPSTKLNNALARVSQRLIRNASTITVLLGLSFFSATPAKAEPLIGPAQRGIPFLAPDQSKLVFIFSFGVLVGHVATRREEEKAS